MPPKKRNRNIFLRTRVKDVLGTLLAASIRQKYIFNKTRIIKEYQINYKKILQCNSILIYKYTTFWHFLSFWPKCWINQYCKITFYFFYVARLFIATALIHQPKPEMSNTARNRSFSLSYLTGNGKILISTQVSM